MNVQQTIDFLIAHNVEIIQWLVAAILITFVIFLAFSLFRKTDKSSSLDSTDDIRKALKEVLETNKQTPGAPVVAGSPSAVGTTLSATGKPAASGDNGAEAAKLQAQIEALRKELEEKSGAGAADPAKDEKIAELESKLSEYEILEDDIADLSLYKEENEKLKKQLESLGAGGEAPAADVPAAEAAAPNDNLVQEFAAAMEPSEPEATPAAEPEPAPAEEVKSEPAATTEVAAEVAAAPAPAPKEDFVAEFESAVTLSKDIPPAPTGEVSTAGDELAGQSADDLMAEFERSMSDDSGSDANAATTAASSPKDDEESGTNALDTEKMLAEMADLEALPADSDGSSSLEEDIDTDKMAAEASNLKE